MEPKVNTRNWLVVYAKPRTEKTTAERLKRLGVEVYCPLQNTVKQWSDRKKKVQVPIFSSYIFVYVSEQERIKVLQDQNVLRFVFWLGKPAIIRDKEIHLLKQFLSDNSNKEIELVYEMGSKVVINQGPFKNVSGVIVDVLNNKPIIELSDLGVKLVAHNSLEIKKNE